MTTCTRVATYDLCIVAGQDGDGVRFPIVNAVNQPVDVTGWTAESHVRGNPAGPLVAALTCTCGPDGVTVTWAGSLVWPLTRYVYDVELTSPSGQTYRIVQGTVSVSPQVTHA